MLFQKKMNIGLDLGNDSVKIAIVDAKKGAIINTRKMETVKNRQSKDNLPKENDIVQCVNELISICKKDCDSLRKEVAASIFGGGSICHYIELPNLKPKELELAVHSQAVKHVPFSENMTLSYMKVPRISGGGEKIGVFFIAEHTESVSSVKNIMKQCNLQVSKIESPILALTREFSRNHVIEKDRFTALVYIGFVFTYLIITRGQYPYFAREISLSGRDFTYAFQMGAQSSWQDAENYKIKYDAMQRDVSIEPFLTKLLEEIKRSLYFFKKLFGNENIDVKKVILSGGSAGFINLHKRIEDSLTIPVEVNRTNILKANKKDTDDYHTYAVAVGLALE